MNSSPDWQSLYRLFLNFIQQEAVGLVIVTGLILLAGHIVSSTVNRYIQEDKKKLAINKWTRYITIFLIVMWVLILYNSHIQEDTPFYLFVISILIAGIAISMRDIFSNFVGWLVVISSKGFKNGDRIKIGTVMGDVIDVGIVRTIIAEIGGWVQADQSTGRLISIPNSMVIGQEVYNYTKGYDFIWDEIRVLITFESNWEKAESIINEIAMKDFEEIKDQIKERLKRVKRDYLLRFNYITPKVYVSIKDSGIELALRYMVRVRERRTLNDSVSRNILCRFDREADIDFAYPTMRIYKHGEQAPAP